MPDIDLPSPKAQRLLRVIVEAIDVGHIREGKPTSFLSYSKALNMMGIPFRHAGQELKRNGLDELSNWISAHPELPRIDALIVKNKLHRPGSGFAKSLVHHDGDLKGEAEWWMQEANRAISYDWKPFLAPDKLNDRVAEDAEGLSMLEPEMPDYQKIITMEAGKHGGQPCIRGTRFTVRDILGWLATGKSERKIIKEFPDLTQQDIRASLAYAAEREQKPSALPPGESRLAAVASAWAGKFELPEPDPSDPRMTYLVERYLRHRG